MPDSVTFDYAIIRVVPRVEREEFVNAGVLLICQSKRYLSARTGLDRGRLAALDASLDPEAVERYLEAIARICAGGDPAGPLGRLSQRERFDWLVAPRSTIIQTSAVHSGLCTDPETALEHLLGTMVRAAGTA
jgi:Protein of unknown function (DUF3037)